ncbi:MAG: TlpA family protein disulfide reductase [Phycisphaerales bacterium]|nr:TlpA family protein disulfide reductase [Phycisphaerales bacterium]
MRTRFLAIVLVAGASLSAAAIAATPSIDDDPASAPAATAGTTIDWGSKSAKLRAFYADARKSNQPVDTDALRALLSELLVDVDIDSLSANDIRAHWDIIGGAPTQADRARSRLQQIAKSDTVDGAKAALFLFERGTPGRPTAVNAHLLLDHPALDAMLEEASGREIASMVAAVNVIEADQRGPYVDKVLGWSSRFNADSPINTLRGALGYCSALRDLGDSVPADRFNAARESLVAALTAAAAKADPKDGEKLMAAVKRLDSAAMRGELLDHPAPPLTFTWVRDANGTPAWHALEDLKGKVVVLDFWATWCGPCVASFPNVRELREHYSADDVAIVGVTSLQGAVYWKGKPKTDTTGKPDLEKELMADYMKEMDMTWTVAFTDEEVFNPDYDVSGIPHVAIIDANGVLRWNNLHPAQPFSEKAEKIDALLREAGKTVPERTESN